MMNQSNSSIYYSPSKIKQIVEPHFISEKNKEKLQNKKANGWRVMPYSTA